MSDLLEVLLAFPLHLVAMGCLLMASGFFSGSETALFSLRRYDLKRFAASPRRAERLAAELLRRPRDLLICILFGNMVVNILYFSISATIALDAGRRATWMAPVIATIALILLILLGEVTPKALAINAAATASRIASTPLFIFSNIVSPAVRLLARAVAWAIAPFTPEGSPHQLSEEDLRALLAVGEEHGALHRRERDLIEDVMALGRMRVREVMVPRVDMVAFDIAGPPDELKGLFRQGRMKSIPVYEEYLDNVIGVIFAKELFLRGEEDMRALVHDVAFVPDLKSVESLLRDFRAGRDKIAIVVDEYGGTAGLITLEDIVEEVVGEIEDEFDESEVLLKVVGRDRYVIAGMLDLRDLAEALGIELGVVPANTVGGFVSWRLGRLPEPGAQVTYRGWVFTVEEMGERRVGSVVVKRQ